MISGEPSGVLGAATDAARTQRARIEPRFGADPIQYVSQDAEAGRGKPDHGGTDEADEQAPPRTVRQEQNRAEDNIDAHGHIDSPLEIPTVDLQEIKIATIRLSEPRLEAEPVQHIADRAETGQRDIDGDEPGGDDPENPQRIDQYRQQRAGQQDHAGDQPDGPLDIPAVGGNDVYAFAQCHGCNVLRSRADASLEKSYG